MVIDPTAYSTEIVRLKKDNQWISQIIDRAGCCLLCGWDLDPRIIENHHIAGKNNSDIYIPVCPNCHQILCQKQSSWPVDWTQPDNPPSKRLSFIARGLSDIANIQAKLLKDLSVELSGDGGHDEH